MNLNEWLTGNFHHLLKQKEEPRSRVTHLNQSELFILHYKGLLSQRSCVVSNDTFLALLVFNQELFIIGVGINYCHLNPLILAPYYSFVGVFLSQFFFSWQVYRYCWYSGSGMGTDGPMSEKVQGEKYYILGLPFKYNSKCNKLYTNNHQSNALHVFWYYISFFTWDVMLCNVTNIQFDF